jgi:hypothetical protein
MQPTVNPLLKQSQVLRLDLVPNGSRETKRGKALVCRDAGLETDRIPANDYFGSGSWYRHRSATAPKSPYIIRLVAGLGTVGFSDNPRFT